MTKKLISRKRLVDMVLYDPTTGIFTWRYSRKGHIKQGEIAGAPDSNGYWTLLLDGQRYSAHRVAWFWVYGYWPKNEIDHINLKRNDNRLNNLREATRNQNQHNRRANKTNKTKLKGVTYIKHTKKWMAQIQRNNQHYYLGVYSNPQDAHMAYCSAASVYHGKFARTE